MKNITNQNGIYLASEVEKAQWEKDHTLVCPICGKTFIGWKNRARETLYSGCLLTLLVTKKRSTKVAIKLTPARVILTGDFFRSFGFRPGRRGN